MTSYTKLSDSELATLLRAGDEAAFKAVYQKYWDKLLAITSQRLGSIGEAEETIQDIFLNLWKRKERFELRVNFDHYFAVAVKFEIINRLAKRSRERERDKAFAQEIETRHEPQQIRLDLQMLQRQLEAAINSLPPKCQLVFRMSRETDLNNKQIAKKLNISVKAVEKHITHAIKLLKSRFGLLLVFAALLSPRVKRMPPNLPIHVSSSEESFLRMPFPEPSSSKRSA